MSTLGAVYSLNIDHHVYYSTPSGPSDPCLRRPRCRSNLIESVVHLRCTFALSMGIYTNYTRNIKQSLYRARASTLTRHKFIGPYTREQNAVYCHVLCSCITRVDIGTEPLRRKWRCSVGTLDYGARPAIEYCKLLPRPVRAVCYIKRFKASSG